MPYHIDHYGFITVSMFVVVAFFSLRMCLEWNNPLRSTRTCILYFFLLLFLPEINRPLAEECFSSDHPLRF